MKTKFFNYICAAAVAMSAAGCSDYLDVTDKTSVNPDNFPRSVEQAELLLTSSYAASHHQGLYAFYWFPMGIYLRQDRGQL